MTPTLYPTPYEHQQMMDKGTFTLFHGWDLGHGFAIEYWRGAEANGACLRTLRNGQMVSVVHYATPGAALGVLSASGYPFH